MKKICIVICMVLLYPSMSHAKCEASPSYRQSNNSWYLGENKIETTDRDTFHVLGRMPSDQFNPCGNGPEYAADNSHVYYFATVLPGADPRTFAFLKDGYSRDLTHIYYLDSLLIDADPKTFVFLQNGYAQDGKTVFYFGKALEGVDSKTFRQISPDWFKDASHVYHLGTAIKEADTATFIVVGEGITHDATHVFFYSSIVAGADPNDIKLLGGEYWSSRNTIFIGDKPLVDADQASFEVPHDVQDAFTAQDKTHFFFRDKPYAKSECRKVGEVILACKDYILNAGFKSSQLDSASLSYLGRFPATEQVSRMCPFIENTMIYQDDYGIYAVSGGGMILPFSAIPSGRKFDVLDKPLQDMLCASPPTNNRFPTDNILAQKRYQK